MSAPQRTGYQAGDYSAIPSEAPPPRLITVAPDCGGLRLDQALARLFPEYSRSRLQAWVREGRVEVDGRPGEAKQKVWGGECLLLRAEAQPLAGPAPAEAIALPVVYEDDTLIVIDKPAGLVVHPGSGVHSGTLMNALLHHAPRLRELPRAGIVHRLDKDTSGLLVVAKTLAAQTSLVRQLQARTVRRLYCALVWGALSGAGTVDAPIGRHPVQRTRMAVAAAGRAARTRYRVIEHLPGTTLVECALDTGRTHQIRVHMASIGHPLVGDVTYGSRRRGGVAGEFPRQALHAMRLGLVHPELGQEMHWQAPLPEDFARLLEALHAQQDGP